MSGKRCTGLGNKRDGMRGGRGREGAVLEASVRHSVRYCPHLDQPAGAQVSSRHLGGRQRHPGPSQHLLFTESLHKLLLVVFRDMNFLPVPRFRGEKKVSRILAGKFSIRISGEKI